MAERSPIAILATASLLAAGGADAGPIDKEKCAFNGRALYGKVQFVESFPDVKVQIVRSFADLKVQTVESFPDACGKWQKVTSSPDIKIEYVKTFPGVP